MSVCVCVLYICMRVFVFVFFFVCDICNTILLDGVKALHHMTQVFNGLSACAMWCSALTLPIRFCMHTLSFLLLIL